MSSSRGKKATIPTSKKRKGTSSSPGPTTEVRHPFLRLVRHLSILEFGTALGLYMKEFKEENDLDTLNRHIHRSR
ncbi:hypothetical protein PVK06_008409 [Gossypium arboreum]|uniref:Uncharacterized protein n=1 Tax=Gossypium arboreum TaxID=29729 RepID=A0ABR0QKM8_GOSAR|nr:hypothetical protein PVK06_008409 [Gossypium arboreum]